MKLPGQKSRPQRVLQTIGDSLEGANPIGHSLSTFGAKSDLRAALPDGARKAGLVAGGVAGLTAASAGISSYRRRSVGASDDS